MSIALITGAAGLIGSEAAMFFANRGLDIVGVDNDMRRVFFGNAASTAWNRARVEHALGQQYTQRLEYDVPRILREIHGANSERW